MPKLARARFNKNTASSLTCPEGDRYIEIRDAGFRGLSIRATAGGSKSYYIQLNRSTKRIVGDARLLTLTEARNTATDMLAAHQAGNTPESRRESHSTLGEFLLGPYNDWYSKHSPRYGERDTKRLISALGTLSNKRLDHISQFAVEKWKASRDVKPATLNRELAQLKAALNRAVEWSFLKANPAKKVRPLKDNSSKRVRFLSDTERKHLYDALNKRDDYLSYMVRVVLMTGLRRGEVFSLEWADINLKTKILIVHARHAKSSKERYIPLNAPAVDFLKAWKLKSGIRSGIVFPNPSTGKRLNDNKTAWGTLMKKAKIDDFRFHDLRHDFASRLVMSGVDLYRVKELLGHSSIAMTERYAHLAPKALADAVGVLA
ncbi:tyrosine-type recombinase/integrase [Pseudomonadota bacterium]